MSIPVVSILYLMSAFGISLKRNQDNYPIITQEDIQNSSITDRFGILLTSMLGVDRYNDKSMSTDKRVVYVYGTISLLLSFASLLTVESLLGTPTALYVILLLFCFGVAINLLDWGCTNASTINITNRCCGEFVMWPLLGMALAVFSRQCGSRSVQPLIVLIFLVLAAYDYNSMQSNTNTKLCRALTHHAFSFLFGVMTGYVLSPAVVVMPTTFVVLKKKPRIGKPTKQSSPKKK